MTYCCRVKHGIVNKGEKTMPRTMVLYSKCMFALIDKFGVSWCLFI